MRFGVVASASTSAGSESLRLRFFWVAVSWSALLEELLVGIEAFESAFAAEAKLPALSVSGALMISLGTAAVAGGGWRIDRVGAAELGGWLVGMGALLLCLCIEFS